MVWKRGRPLDKSGIGPQGRIAIRGPSVLTVLAVLPGFSKGGGRRHLLSSGPRVMPLQRLVAPSEPASAAATPGRFRAVY